MRFEARAPTSATIAETHSLLLGSAPRKHERQLQSTLLEASTKDFETEGRNISMQLPSHRSGDGVYKV